MQDHPSTNMDPNTTPIQGPGTCRLWVGTSGYSYSEWGDAGFYPPGTRANHMLPLYARTFPITELNYTWYQMPKAHTVDRMRRQVPPRIPVCRQVNPHLDP